MKRVPALGRAFFLATLLSQTACGAFGPSAVEAEPSPTPDFTPIASAACGAWINQAQTEMNTLLEPQDAAEAKSLCTMWLSDNWYMADNESYLLGQTAVTHIDQQGIPINDARGHKLAVMLQHEIMRLLGTPTPEPFSASTGE